MTLNSDNVNGVRSLSHGAAVAGQVTLESCTSACFNAGYRFSGAEYSAYVLTHFFSILLRPDTVNVTVDRLSLPVPLPLWPTATWLVPAITWNTVVAQIV